MPYQQQIQGDQKVETIIGPHAAATTTEDSVIFVAPFDCTVSEVSLYPGADVTGQDTNTTHLNLFNRGTDGLGVTELANYDLTLGNDLSEFVEKELYKPGTALSVDAGTRLSLQHEKILTGLDVSSLGVVVTFRSAV